MSCSLQDGKTALHLAVENDVVDILVKHDPYMMDMDTKHRVSDL